MEHLLLLCPSFDAQCWDLLDGIVELIRQFVQTIDLSNDTLTHLLLFGDQDLSNEFKGARSRNVNRLFSK